MSIITVTIKNSANGLRIIFTSDNKDKQVGIVMIRNRKVDDILLDKLLLMDLNIIGIYHKSIMIEIFESIKEIVSNLYLKKKWSVSFNKDIK